LPTVNVEQNRAAIKAALKVNPGRSNRYIGRLVGVHHVTVGLVRGLMEKAGEMPRMEAMLGADGKSYSRDRVHAPAKTSSLDELLSTALTSLTCDVRKEGRVGELASALRRHAKRLSVEAKQPNGDGHVADQVNPVCETPLTPISAARTCNAETLPPRPISVQSSEKAVPVEQLDQQQPTPRENFPEGKASDRSIAAERPPAPAAPPQQAPKREHPKPLPRTWRDVARDIAVETERRALANGGAAERHPSDGVGRSDPAERARCPPHRRWQRPRAGGNRGRCPIFII
jgi:hypothetical protein